MQRMTRNHAISAGFAGAALLAFWVASASAQTMPVAPMAPKSDKMTQAVLPAAGDMMADKIQGLNVYTLKADRPVPAPTTTGVQTVTKEEYSRLTGGYQKIGAIDDIVIGADGRVKDAVVSVGGFLGVGERNVALGWGDISFVRTSEGDTFAFVNKPKAELEKIPEFKPMK